MTHKKNSKVPLDNKDFSDLAHLKPTRKLNKGSILTMTIEYIEYLQEQNKEYKVINEKLREQTGKNPESKTNASSNIVSPIADNSTGKQSLMSNSSTATSNENFFREAETICSRSSSVSTYSPEVMARTTNLLDTLMDEKPLYSNTYQNCAENGRDNNNQNSNNVNGLESLRMESLKFEPLVQTFGFPNGGN